MTAIFFHVSAGSNHPLLSEYAAGTANIDYAATLEAACIAYRKAVPNSQIVLLTDIAGAERGFVHADHVVGLNLDSTLIMYSRMRAYRALILSGAITGPTVFLDTDICLQKNFTPLFDKKFAIGLTYRNNVGQTHMPINEGVILADLAQRESVATAFSRCLATYEWLAAQGCSSGRSTSLPSCLSDRDFQKPSFEPRGNAWEFERFGPMDAIPTAVNLTTYSGGAEDFISTPLQTIVDAVELGSFSPPIGKVFEIDDIVGAHRAMEENTAGGKIVVTV